MKWHCSAALEVEYLAANSLDGEQFAPWNMLPFAPDDSCSAKMKGTCHRSPFGTMSVPSTDGPGTALLTWFLEASRVRTSRPPERGGVLQENAPAYGPIWQGSSVKLDPDGSWSKILLSLLPGDSMSFSGTWPKWGTMRNGECWERLTSVPRTNGTESGLLPTPLASLGTNGGPNQRDSSGRPGLQMAALAWPTPPQRDWKSGKASLETMQRNSRPLSEMVLWNTPVQDDAHPRKNGKWNSRGEPKLSAQVLLPTPNCSGFRSDGELRILARSVSDPEEFLGMTHKACKSKREKFFPTPTASTGGPEPEGKTGRKLTTVVGGQLSADWTEWLMGWPIGWTDSKPLEMGKFLQWLHSHSAHSPKGS